MTGPAVWILALTVSAPATSPDPASLAVPPADRAKADALVSKLGNPAYRVREAATAELQGMGRLALPAIRGGLTAADTETRVKCQWLLPPAAAADRKARFDVFLADTAGQFDHDLAGWTQLKSVAGNTPAARKLFVEMAAVQANDPILAAMGDPAELAARVSARRLELSTRGTNRVVIAGAGGVVRLGGSSTTNTPGLSEVAALVLGERFADTARIDRRYSFLLNSLLNAQAVRDAVRGDGPTGPAVRALVVDWITSRTEAADLYTAMTLAATLNLPDLPAAAVAERMLARPPANEPPTYRMFALGQLARTNDKKYLPALVKAFGETGSINFGRVGVNGAAAIQPVRVGDVALSFAVQMLGKKPTDYGLVTNGTFAGNANAFYPYSHGFPSDAARGYGFTKFAFEQLRK